MTLSPVGRAALLCLLCLSWLSATAWLRPLHLPDEGRYVGVAYEMVRSAEWCVVFGALSLPSVYCRTRLLM